MPPLWRFGVARFPNLWAQRLDPPQQCEAQAPALEARLNSVVRELVAPAIALIFNSRQFDHWKLAIGPQQLAATRQLESPEAVIKTLGAREVVYLVIASGHSQIPSRICLSQSSLLLA